MSRQTGVVPRRDRSVNDRPSEYSLIRKAEALGLPITRHKTSGRILVKPLSVSSDPADVLLSKKSLTPLEHRAFSAYSRLYVSIFGRPVPSAVQVLYSLELVDKEGSSKSSISDDEMDSIRERSHSAYLSATTVIKRANEKAHNAILDLVAARYPHQLGAAKIGLSSLAKHWHM